MMVNKSAKYASILAAVLVPLAYLLIYTPYGMDTTDFGYFYGYAWRILEGEIPYRDFFYIKPAFPLYWHAFWLNLTPFQWQILAGKAGFCLTMLLSAWFGSLFLNRIFNLAALGLNAALLATAAFVFSIHTFPHMPWHTADGVLFSSAALYLSFAGCPALGGILGGAAVLCKQSFALVPIAIALALFLRGQGIKPFLFSFAIVLALWCLWLYYKGAWPNFLTMTTGQLALSEALDAGILIYLRQNWLIPLASLVPLLFFRLIHKPLPGLLAPAFCYLACLAAWYLHAVFTTHTWIGFGISWPTFFMCLGVLAALLPRFFLVPYATPGPAQKPLSATCAFGASLIIAWSCAISGGYKIPAFFSAPLLLAFFICHARLFRPTPLLPWAALVTGLAIFGAGWFFPYTFPIRPLAKSDLKYDAGTIYPQATGVLVDRDMLERLAELKMLRARYGSNYKTLPGFTLAYLLNGDKPAVSSDWLIDWEINGQTDRLLQELTARDVIVFMERDQMETTHADGYARAGYSVPQYIRHNWRILDETPHFVVFRRPQPPLL